MLSGNGVCRSVGDPYRLSLFSILADFWGNELADTNQAALSISGGVSMCRNAQDEVTSTAPPLPDMTGFDVKRVGERCISSNMSVDGTLVQQHSHKSCVVVYFQGYARSEHWRGLWRRQNEPP
jgi:hypothetical protein